MFTFVNVIEGNRPYSALGVPMLIGTTFIAFISERIFRKEGSLSMGDPCQIASSRTICKIKIVNIALLLYASFDSSFLLSSFCPI